MKNLQFSRQDAVKMDIIAQCAISGEVGDWEVESVDSDDFWGYADRMIILCPHLFKKSTDGGILLKNGNVQEFIDGGGFEAMQHANQQEHKSQEIRKSKELQLIEQQIGEIDRVKKEARSAKRISIIALIIAALVPFLVEILKVLA